MDITDVVTLGLARRTMTADGQMTIRVGQDTISAVTNAKPASSPRVLAVAGESSATVHFDLVPGATGYTVSWPGGSVQVATSPAIITGLVNGQQYTFTVSALNARGVGTGKVSNAVTPTALPAALTGLKGLMCRYVASSLALSDGAAVAAWPDASGNGYAATQSVAAKQPVFVANWLGTGKPAVRFDGAASNADVLLSSLTQALLGADATIIAVCSADALTNGSGARDQRVISGETTRYDRGFALSTSDGGQGTGGNNFWTVRGGSSEINAASAAGTITINTPYSLTALIGAQLFVNGARQTEQCAGLCQLLPRKQGFWLGGPASQELKGCIAEVLFFRGRLADADRQKVDAYIAAQYGISMVYQSAA